MNYHTEEAEKALVGAVLLDSTILDRLDSKIEDRDFSNPILKLIWKSIQHMHKNDKAIDIVTVTTALQAYDRLDEIGGFGYLQELVTNTVTPSNYKHYAEIIHQSGIRMRIAQAGEEIIRIANESLEKNEELYNRLENIVDKVRDETVIKPQSIKDMRDEYEKYLFSKRDCILTGFPQFDAWANGIERGCLYVLSARPGVGKTAKMLQMARSIAVQNIGTVVIFSLEMKKEELVNRMLSSITSISLSAFKLKNEMEESNIEKIRDGLNTLEKLPIRIVDKEGISIEEVRALSRQIKRETGSLGAIFIDYLGIMNLPADRGLTHSQRIGEVTKRAKWLALEMLCPLFLLSQMNREAERSTKPTLMHLRDSGSIEQDADIVEILWKDPEDTNPGVVYGASVVQSIIAKGRSIGVNTFRYAFKGWSQQFKDLPKRDRE